MKLFIALSALVGSSIGCGLLGPAPETSESGAAAVPMTTGRPLITLRAPTACEIRRNGERAKFNNGEQTGIVSCKILTGDFLPTVVNKLILVFWYKKINFVL